MAAHDRGRSAYELVPWRPGAPRGDQGRTGGRLPRDDGWRVVLRRITQLLVRGLGSVSYFASASGDHSRILVRVNPDAERDKGEIRLLFGWADRLSR